MTVTVALTRRVGYLAIVVWGFGMWGPARADSGALRTQSPSFAGSLAIASEYHWAGYSLSKYRPAVQLWVEAQWPSGWYVANWNSTVDRSLYSQAWFEGSVYGGYRTSWRGYDWDLALNRTIYVRSSPPFALMEAIVQVGRGPFTVRATLDVSRTFSAGPLEGSGDGNLYLEALYARELGGGWGVNARLGQLFITSSYARYLESVHRQALDYKLAVTRAVGDWTIELGVTGNQRKALFLTGASDGSQPAGKFRPVLSLTRAF